VSRLLGTGSYPRFGKGPKAVLLPDLSSPSASEALLGRCACPSEEPRFGERWQERKITGLISDLRSRLLASQAFCERFEVALLGEGQRVLGHAGLGDGRLDALSIRLRELFREALRVDATAMILAHNHPSGDCRPSAYDIAATQRIAFVGRSLEIALVDHLIFTQADVYSMRKGGEL